MDAALAAHLRAVVRPIPAVVGHTSCARSQGTLESEIPVDGVGNTFDSIVAIARIVRADGTVAGWIYRTKHDHFVMQTITPPLVPFVIASGPSPAHEESGLDLVRKPLPGTVKTCTADDYLHGNRYK